MASFDVPRLVAAAQQTAAELDRYDRSGRRQQWWDERCAALSRDRPLQRLTPRRVERAGQSLTVRHRGDVLTVPGIVQISGCSRWGSINNREYVFVKMMDRLLGAYRAGDWDAWARMWVQPPDAIDACVVRGFGHDLVFSGSGGRHRMMAAAIFGFPELPATLYRTARILAGDRIVLDGPQERAHLRRLVRDGAITDPSPAGHSFTVLEPPEAEWSYDHPESVERHADLLRRAYPTAAIDPAMQSAETWRAKFGTPTGRFAAVVRKLRGETLTQSTDAY